MSKDISAEKRAAVHSFSGLCGRSGGLALALIDGD